MPGSLMTPDLVRLEVAPPGDKLAVIGMMADLIAATGRAERDGLEAGLLKREESFDRHARRVRDPALPQRGRARGGAGLPAPGRAGRA